MNDIVEELRQGPSGFVMVNSGRMTKAADEIERLREEIKSLELVLKNYTDTVGWA